MKICLVTSFPPSRDALNEYGYHIACELRNLPGIELTILADHYSPVQPELEGFTVVRCWRFNALANVWRLLKAIWREKPDVVWFNLGFASFGGTPLPAFAGILSPALARVAGFYTHVTLHQLMETVNLNDAGVRFPILYKAGGFLATQLVLCSNSVSVMLPAYRNVLIEKYGRGAVYVRRHGIFSTAPEYPDFGQRGNPEHRILAFGKWGTYKRLEPVLEAFEAVVQHCPEARLVIAGTDHPKTPGYLRSIQKKYSLRKEVSFLGYVSEEDVAHLLQRSTVAVLPYTSSAGSSGIAHLACTYGVPIIASDIPDFCRLANEENLAIDFFPVGDIAALAAHLISLLQNRDRQVEMALHNSSAALRMSMPEIIRQYLQTFELRQDLETLRSITLLRRLPHWFPLRNTLLRRKARNLVARPVSAIGAPPSGFEPARAEVVYISRQVPTEVTTQRTGTGER